MSAFLVAVFMIVAACALGWFLGLFEDSYEYPTNWDGSEYEDDEDDEKPAS